MTVRLLLTLVTTLLLAGCNIPGMGPDPRIALREAEAKAIGGACRYGVRGIEDCYSLNEGASKAAIFAGWKDMDEYMSENKIEGVRAVIAKSEPAEVILEDKSTQAVAADKAPAKDASAAAR
ncbi:MAG: hypothetical protein ACYC4S_05415 [Rhodoferax sp.]